MRWHDGDYVGVPEGGIDRLDLPPHHEVGNFLRTCVAAIECSHELTIAEHGNAIGQPKDFVHFVGNVEYRDATFS